MQWLRSKEVEADGAAVLEFVRAEPLLASQLSGDAE